MKLATEAHDGLDRWNQLKSLKAHLSVTGGLWHVKDRPDVLNDIRIELPLHDERLTFSWMSVLDSVHVSYDGMASSRSPYGNAEALKVAGDLDAKVEALLASVAP